MMALLIKLLITIIVLLLCGVICVLFINDKIPHEKKEQTAPTQKLTAVVACCGAEHDTDEIFEYMGDLTCSSAVLLYGGNKSCPYSCIGYGDCEKICPQNAIKMKDGLPVIDSLKCNFCKKCIESCPKGLIRPQSSAFSYYVACANRRYSKTSKFCETGCNGCGKCIDACDKGAITFDRSIIIDHSLCDLCGKCADACVRGVIKHI